MSFWLKKVVEFWLMPLPFLLVLLAIACWRLRRRRSPALALGAAFVLLLLGSNILVSTRLVHPLEWAFSPVPELAEGAPAPPGLADCRYVVVLGAGHADSAELAALDKLSYSGIERLVEGVRLLRHLPAAVLIVSGPAAGAGATHASVLAATAVSLGVAPARIRQIDTARDTEEESAAVRGLVGDAKVALVTSAVHMPRAAALFRSAGVRFLPCPTDFTAKPAPHLQWYELRCDVESLERTTTFVREGLGLAWLRLRGKLH